MPMDFYSWEKAHYGLKSNSKHDQNVKAVEKDPWAIQCLTEEQKTKEVCELAVKKCGSTIWCVPDNLMTEELFLLAVQNDYRGIALSFVPEHLKTQEMCLAAFKTSTFSLQYIPDEFITREMCYEAVCIHDHWFLFDNIPERFKDVELCSQALKNSAKTLEMFLVMIHTIPEKVYKIMLRDIHNRLKYFWDAEQTTQKNMKGQ